MSSLCNLIDQMHISQQNQDLRRVRALTPDPSNCIRGGEAIYAKFNHHIRKILSGSMLLGMAFSGFGVRALEADTGTRAGIVGPTVTAAKAALASLVSASPNECFTQTVRITLASEQISFCAPTSLPIDIVEDSTSDPYVSYAGLDQINGYGIVNIKATTPGNTPGSGRPIYNLDGVLEYRQAVWNIESSKTDRIVSNGPTGVFWNETVPGIQVDVSLPTSSGNLKLRSIEWYLEHNSRLWSFIITWDTETQNASGWDEASKNFSVQEPGGEKLADTALDLGAVFPESKSAQDTLHSAGPVDVGEPPWWSGICDDNNYFPYTDIHSTLLSTWLGVSACGPVPTTDYAVQFFPGAWGEYEFECVELVMRFLYLEWGIKPWPGNANQIKNSPPSSIVFYPNGTHAIVPGDIITENGSAQNSVGHTALITDVNLDDNGTGTIRILEQNASSAGHRRLSVENWQVKPDAWCFGQTIQGWLHVKVSQNDGVLDLTFAPGTESNGRVVAIALQPDGKVLIGGDFTSYNGTTRNHIARLNSDGSLDPTFDPGPGVSTTDGSPPRVVTLAIQSDGKVLIGGHFDSYNGATRYHIARLNSNGSLVTDFVPETGVNADVFRIAVQTDGKILVGGDDIVRLNSNGSLDTTFTSMTNNNVRDLAIQPGGKIIVVGDFSKVNNTDRAGIARLNSDGSLDATFDPGIGTDDGVASIALQEDGKILIGGNFSHYNGISRNKVARLNNDGSLDLTFDPGTGISGNSDFVQTIVPQPDGRILIGGDFSSYNGTALNRLGRLNNDGSLEASFKAATDNVVEAIVLQPDGKVIIGGDFTDYIARLLNHIKYCYTLNTLVNQIEGGSVTIDPAPNCAGTKYISDMLVQLTAVTNPDYWLLNWSGDATGSYNPLGVIMNNDKSVTANFMPSPGHFNKSLPGNGATGLPANPSLSWGTSNDATSYEYCMDKTNNNGCDSDTWISTGASNSITLSNLPPYASFYWQARARNAVDTTDADASTWWSFTRNGIPAVPVTISPSGTIIDTHPPYVWNESSGATSYQLTVYSISTSTPVIDDAVNSSSCSGGVCTYHPSVALPLGNYEFRVSASAAGASEYSAWSTFTVVRGLFLPLIFSSGG